MENKEILLEMRNIHKHFPGVYALKDVQLTLRKGEVLGLIGENGAGKSTLMRILGGVIQKDQGTVKVSSKLQENHSPAMAQEEGIVFVHQEINLAESLTVAENLFLGRLPRKRKGLNVIDYDKLFSDSSQILSDLGINIDIRETVSNLSAAQKQMIEIGKAISQNAKILIFDEPTTSLSDKDVDILFNIIRKLKNKGVGIIYISHRLKEIFEICDRVTVLRDGNYISENDIADIENEDLIRMMVGRELTQLYPKIENQSTDEVAIEVRNLSDHFGKVKDVSFHAHKGEILGISGLVGAGRTETMKLIFGVDQKQKGQIYVHGREIKVNSPNDAINNGICLLTEDRKKEGLCLELSVSTNLTLTSLDSFVLNLPKLRNTSKKLVEMMQIKTPSIDTSVLTLSGGNQQKVIIGKWLNKDSDIYIFDEPTKGIDIGAKNEIYKKINELVEKGKTIILISSELPELIGMCDRAYVMCEGKITGELNRDEFTQERIMALATMGGV